MEAEEYARIAAVENNHWWYRNTRAIVADLLSPWLGRDLRILDAGCGPGGNSAWLARHGTVVALDHAAEALQFVRGRRPELRPVRASIGSLPFPDTTFDIVTAITVAYSVPDDATAVRELARVLRPGGVCVLMEPAFRVLRRAHDVTVHGLRRYRRADLIALADRAGLQVERTTYAYSFLVVPAAALAVRDRLRPQTPGTGSDVRRRALDGLFGRLASWERRILARRDVPVGTSVVLVATKRPR